MSALSTLSKKIAAWEATVTEVELVVNGLAADDAETILSAFNRTKDVSLELDMSVADVVKLITKSNNKDPITGLYRYGPEARAKISGLETSIAILKNKCQSVIEKTLGLLQNNNITVKELFQPAANLSKATVAPVAGPIRSIDLEFRAENSKRYTEETLEESPDLLEKAKHVRERKAQEQRDGTASNASIENLLQLHASFLEKVRLHHAKLSAQKEASTLYLGDPLALFLKEPNQVKLGKQVPCMFKDLILCVLLHIIFRHYTIIISTSSRIEVASARR